MQGTKGRNISLSLLRDLGDHQSAGYIGHPVRKLEPVWGIIDVWRCNEWLIHICVFRLRRCTRYHITPIYGNRGGNCSYSHIQRGVEEVRQTTMLPEVFMACGMLILELQH